MKLITRITTFLLLGATCLLAGGSKLTAVAGDDPRKLAGLVVDDLLSREHMLYGNSGIHYAEVFTAIGALRFTQQTGDKARLDQIIARYSPMLEEGNVLISRNHHVDHNVMGALPLQIYMINGDKRFLELGLSFADQQWENATVDGLTPQTRWWIDDMYMVGMLQIQAYRATKETKYSDRAARQLAAYLAKLQQDDGLFYHGPDFHYYWGRGNGWVAASLAEVLSALADDHALRPALLDGYRKMMASLLKHQTETGMWRQIIDYPYSWEESSCTGMFAFALSVGVRNGWLEGDEFKAALEKATRALCGYVDRKGRMREICIGTGQQDDIEYYLMRPRTLGDFHGQAPFLWLVAEVSR